MVIDGDRWSSVDRDRWLVVWRGALTVVLLVLLAGPPATAVQAAPALLDETYAPGATGAASFAGRFHIFARRGDGAVWVRQTDGLWYSGWSPLGGYTETAPAAASTGHVLAVFIRDAGGQLWVRRSLDGVTYDAWHPLGGGVGALAAVGTSRQLQLFTLDRQGLLSVRTSADGREFRAPQSLGGPLAAVPLVRLVDGRPEVVGLGRDGHRYVLTTDVSGVWRAWRGISGLARTLPTPEDPATPPSLLLPELGINFISEHNWTSYQLPAYSRLRPGLAKFSMFYDAFPTTPVFSSAAIDDAIAQGARTVIFRTAETRIAPDEVERQLHAPLPGGARSLLDYIAAHQASGSGVAFWIEVGNEPDLAGVSPLVARYGLLATMRDVAPRYRASHPNLRWLASLPTSAGLPTSALPEYRGLAYLDLLLSDLGDGLGTVAAHYDALAVHLYGADTLQQSFPLLHAPADRLDCANSNGDALCPLVVLDRILAQTDRPIFVTEAGINSAAPWGTKAKLYVELLQRLPARVWGVALFTLSLDPEWYAGEGVRCPKFDLTPCARYALDVDESGRVDPAFTGASGIAYCAALAPAELAATSTCGEPCVAMAVSPLRPRSTAQRRPCPVGADLPEERRPGATVGIVAALWQRRAQSMVRRWQG